MKNDPHSRKFSVYSSCSASKKFSHGVDSSYFKESARHSLQATFGTSLISVVFRYSVLHLNPPFLLEGPTTLQHGFDCVLLCSLVTIVVGHVKIQYIY